MKKIVIKVQMHGDKSRSKALKIAAVVPGVKSVSLEGESKDQVVVTGDGVDSVCLVNQLRKKFHCATILSVEDVKSEPKKEEKQQSKVICYNPCYCPPSCPPYNPCYCPPSCPPYYQVVCDPNPNSCSIL